MNNGLTLNIVLVDFRLPTYVLLISGFYVVSTTGLQSNSKVTICNNIGMSSNLCTYVISMRKESRMGKKFMLI